MEKTKNPGFWKTYNMGKVFICSHCGAVSLSAADTCPKCQREMRNSASKKN